MTKTQQRKQLREIARNLSARAKVEVCIIEKQYGDVYCCPISESPLITGSEHGFYLSGWRRDGFGWDSHFELVDHINLKMTDNGIEAA